MNNLASVFDKSIDVVTDDREQYVTDFIEQRLNNLLDQIYPIGSIYYNVLDTDPNNFLIGLWEKIENRFLLASGSDYVLGNTGGEAVHTLTVAETPAHTHTRGTMEITGTWTYMTSESSSNWTSYPCTGAADFSNKAYSKGLSTSQYASSSTAGRDLTFTASKGWTGATSSVGSSQSHNNMPPYLVVNVWKRVS